MAKFNKPKFSPLQNSIYAWAGLKEITKNESSIKVHYAAFVLFSIGIYFLPIDLGYKIYLFFSMFIPILAELINSAIERVVDLVTTDYDIMAKYAKDAGSAIVFVALLGTFFSWVAVMLLAFKVIG